MVGRVTAGDRSLHSPVVPEDLQLITAIDRTPVSPARVHDPSRTPLRVGAVQHRCPITVHVALGTDIVHQHPNADGAAIGLASYTDFKILAGQLCQLQPGAVVLLFGSAVILPEVFLKALTVARNLGHPAHGSAH